MAPKEGHEIFFAKSLAPMLIYEAEPFDSDEYIFELKLDGIRALAYLDKTKTTIINKRLKDISFVYPELSDLHEQSNTRTVIDGEIVIMSEGKPDFFRLQKRSLLIDKLKIKLSSLAYPVVFAAFDILYCNNSIITDLPLLKRKQILKETIIENNNIVLSRYIETSGKEFFRLAKEKGLEGIVAKHKNSIYHPGKRSRNWLKIKAYEEDDYIICGYVPKPGGIKDLILGEFTEKGKLKEKARINTAKNKKEIMTFAKHHPSAPLFPTTASDIVWMKPYLVGRVSYMMKTASGALRQPVFKGLSPDKVADDILHKP